MCALPGDASRQLVIIPEAESFVKALGQSMVLTCRVETSDGRRLAVGSQLRWLDNHGHEVVDVNGRFDSIVISCRENSDSFPDGASSSGGICKYLSSILKFWSMQNIICVYLLVCFSVAYTEVNKNEMITVWDVDSIVYCCFKVYFIHCIKHIHQ